MSAKRDYYEVLEVSRDALAPDIKRAYRKKAVELHPDRNPGNAQSEEQFKEAAEAFEILGDPSKRQLYDQFGHNGPKRAGFSGFQGAEDILTHFGDIFADLGFGGHRRRTGPQAGADIRTNIVVTLDTIINGEKKEIEVLRHQTCDDCRGTGSADGTPPKSCMKCAGTGHVTHHQGIFTLQTVCLACQGEGNIIEKPCLGCQGKGLKQKNSKITVSIPPGILNGHLLRVAGGGQTGMRGGPNGNLYLQVEVHEDPRFARVGNDLHSEVSVHMFRACLGSTVKAQTLEGEIDLKIKPGTQHGDVMVLRGKGLPVLGHRRRGDQHIKVKVWIPTNLTEEQEEKLRKIAEDQVGTG